MRTDLSLIVLVGVTFVSARGSCAGETEADEHLKRVKAVIEQAINWYDVLPAAEAAVPLRPQIVMRWQNPVRVNTGAAVLAIWTDQGRPAAMASVFEWNGQICHEFGSLSRSGTLVARDRTDVVWSPRSPGVDFRHVPGAPAPAANAAARLRQMKALAERFAAELPDRNGEGKREVLRLLPRPLYRYDLKQDTRTEPRLRDGAILAFALGTDPEVVLLLEAVDHADSTVWQYAFARATGWAAEARLGDRVVWSVGSDLVNRDPASTQIQIHRPLP